METKRDEVVVQQHTSPKDGGMSEARFVKDFFILYLVVHLFEQQVAVLHKIIHEIQTHSSSCAQSASKCITAEGCSRPTSLSAITQHYILVNFYFKICKIISN